MTLKASCEGGILKEINCSSIPRTEKTFLNCPLFFGPLGITLARRSEGKNMENLKKAVGDAGTFLSRAVQVKPQLWIIIIIVVVVASVVFVVVVDVVVRALFFQELYRLNLNCLLLLLLLLFLLLLLCGHFSFQSCTG
jgi:hypothetical protein